MRVLMTGATGFIGGRLARALLAQGHEVVCAVRKPARLDLGQGHWRAIEADLSRLTAASDWRPHLAGIDAVVNAVGILRESAGQTFDALHARAPIALFEACVQAGVPTVVQVSALGADEAAQSRYHRSKKQADDALRAMPLAGAVVQPSAVYGPGSEAAALFNTMATAPLLLMPQAGAMVMQPLHVDDVVEGVVRLLQAPPARVTTFAFTGPQPLSMAGYLRALRAALGVAGGLLVLPLPTWAFLASARLAALVPGSVLDAETAGMLLRGNAAPADDFTRLLGRSPRPVSAFIPPEQAPALRRQAQRPLRLALAAAAVVLGVAAVAWLAAGSWPA